MQKKSSNRKLKGDWRSVSFFAEKQRDDALDKVKELCLQFYKTVARLEEEQGKYSGSVVKTKI